MDESLETPMKRLSTSILPPLETSAGRLEIHPERDRIEFIPHLVKYPWRLQTLEKRTGATTTQDPDAATAETHEYELDCTINYAQPSSTMIDDNKKLQYRPSQELMLQQLLLNRKDYAEESHRAQEEQRRKLKELRAKGMNMILNNAQDAGDRTIWMDRHVVWCNEHEKRLRASKERHEIELKRKKEYILQATSEYRRQAKREDGVRRIREQAKKECCSVVILASATNLFLKQLQQQWEIKRKTGIVRRVCRVWLIKWRRNRQKRDSAHVLYQTLHEWNLYSLSQRTAVGLQQYFKAVRIIQRRVKYKVSKRKGRMEALLRLWKAHEIMEKETHERKTNAFRVGQRRSGVVRSLDLTKRKGISSSTQCPEELMIVPEETRDAILGNYLADLEREFHNSYLVYLEQEWPILVQLIAEEQAGISRNDAKRQAQVYRRTWKVSTKMSQLSPSKNYHYPIFSLAKIPIKELIEKGRRLAFPSPIVIEPKENKKVPGRRR